MNTLQNLHTHTTFSDGKDTPEEMVLEAINKGSFSVGFSEHSAMSYSPYDYMRGQEHEKYKNEILRLKEKYKDKIDIFLGLEVDMYSSPDMKGFDYLIGSMHYFKIGNEYIAFDRTSKEMTDIKNKYFGGDGLLFAKRYYEELSHLYEYGNFDIIGHFDIIAKHTQNAYFFDESSKEYLSLAYECAKTLSGKIPYFELNTGCISRGYKNVPYPIREILKFMKELGFGVVVTSDCHDKKYLDFYFKESDQLLKANGYNEKYILTKDGFVPVRI